MKKILLVDDDDLMSDMYASLLTLEKYAVTRINNSLEVINKAREINPDLILLDVVMHKADGLSILKLLKSSTDTMSVPVVMLTNLSFSEEIDKALKNGASKYLVKSEYLPKDIAAVVAKILDDQNA